MKRAPVTPSLFAPDLPGSVRFYGETLGFRQTGSYKEEDGSEIWAEVALGDSRIWFFFSPAGRLSRTRVQRTDLCVRR